MGNGKIWPHHVPLIVTVHWTDKLGSGIPNTWLLRNPHLQLTSHSACALDVRYLTLGRMQIGMIAGLKLHCRPVQVEFWIDKSGQGYSPTDDKGQRHVPFLWIFGLPSAPTGLKVSVHFKGKIAEANMTFYDFCFFRCMNVAINICINRSFLHLLWITTAIHWPDRQQWTVEKNEWTASLRS